MAGGYRFTVVITQAEEGGFYGMCPAFADCDVRGETYEETLRKLKAAIEGTVAQYQEEGEPIPEDHTTVEVYEAVINE